MQILERWITAENILISVLTACVASSIILIIYPNPYTKIIPLALLISTISGYIFTNLEEPINVDEFPSRLPKLVIFAYFIISILIIFISHQNAGLRGYLLVGGAIILWLLIGYASLISKPTVGLIMIIGGILIHRLSMYLSSALPIGNDTLFHLRMSEEIAKLGTRQPLIDALSKYASTPLYHISVATNVLTLNVSTRLAGFILAVFTGVVTALIVYEVGKHLWIPRVGVIAAFLISTADWIIAWSIRSMPTSIGLVFFSLLLLFVTKKNHSTRVNSLLIIIFISLSFTHQLSLFITSVVLVTINLLTTFFSDKPTRLSTYVIVFLVLTTQFSFVSYFGPAENKPFIAVVALNLIRQLTTPTRNVVWPEFTEKYTVAGADAVAFWHLIGFGILLTLAITGGIYWRSQLGKEDIRPFSIGGAAATCLGVIFIGPLLGVNLLIPSRWFAFTEILLALLASPCLLIVLKRLRHKYRLIIAISLVIVVIITPYTIVMLSNPPGAVDNPVGKAPAAERLGVTASERAGYAFAADKVQLQVLGDHVSTAFISRHFGGHAKRLHYAPNGSSLDKSSAHVRSVTRKTVTTSFIVRQKGRWLRVHGPIPHIVGNKIYSSGSVRITKSKSGPISNMTKNQ